MSSEYEAAMEVRGAIQGLHETLGDLAPVDYSIEMGQIAESLPLIEKHLAALVRVQILRYRLDAMGAGWKWSDVRESLSVASLESYEA